MKNTCAQAEPLLSSAGGRSSVKDVLLVMSLVFRGGNGARRQGLGGGVGREGTHDHDHAQPFDIVRS